MNTSLQHLPEHKQNQLREITGIIVKAVDPEKVILFGSHATGRWVEHRYTEGGITYEYISDYDILVITKSGESRKDYEVQDVIETAVRIGTAVHKPGSSCPGYPPGWIVPLPANDLRKQPQNRLHILHPEGRQDVST